MENVYSFESELLADPYPQYQRFLASPGPCWLPHREGMDTPGIWLFSRYAEASTLLRMSPDVVSKQISRIKPEQRLSPIDLTMLNMDPPEHNFWRVLVGRTLSPQQILSMEPRIRTQVDRLIDKFIGQGGGDFIANFAIPLPMAIISEMLGIPEQDREMILSWVGEILMGTDSVQKNEASMASQRQAFGELLAYFDGLIAQRTRHLGNDLLSALIVEQKESQRITHVALRNNCAFLLITGYETTTAAFGTGLFTLLKHPDQMQKLRQDPTFLPAAIEEMLRFETPLQRSTFRIAVDDFMLGGVRLKAGDQIGVIIGAANRDPAVFEAPDRFDVTRKSNRHLAFGFGIHACLGAVLARTELRIAFAQLLKWLPMLRLSGAVVWKPSTLIRGLSSLPVSCEL